MPLSHIATLAKVGCNSSLMFQQSQYKMTRKMGEPQSCCEYTRTDKVPVPTRYQT